MQLFILSQALVEVVWVSRLYLQWCLICRWCVCSVQRITAEMHSLYSVSSISHSQSAHIVSIERRLQSAVLDGNLRLHKVGNLSSLCWPVQCQLLYLRPHCVNSRRNRCQEDLNSFFFGELEETTRTPSYYVDEGYPARPEIQQPVPEWINRRGSESSSLETDVYVWC